MSAAFAWWTNLPRAAKWLGALVLFVIGYFAVFEPVMSFGDRFAVKADTLETALKREKDFADESSGSGGIITTTLHAFGRPRTPGDLKPETFTRVVNGILEYHKVAYNAVERRVPLAGDAAAALGVGKIDRLILEVSFEADPATVVAILADLESAKEVAAVSRVRIDKSNSRNEEEQLVRATISPEAWIAAAPGSASSTEVIP